MAALTNIELSDKQVAFVMEKDKETNKIGVYIPTVMSDIEMSDKVWEKEKTLNNNMIVNSNIKIKFEPVTLTNTFKIDPKNISNISSPNLGIGEKVWVSFVDNDLKKCVYTDEAVNESQRTTDSYSISVMARKKLSSDESKYEFNMDSDKQIVELKTTKENGEKDALNFKMDGKEGEIVISTTDGSINIQGEVTDIMKVLAINGINIMDTLEALRNEVFKAINQVVDQTNAVLSSTINNVNSSISDAIGSTNSSLGQLTNSANSCCSDLQSQINALQSGLSSLEGDVGSLDSSLTSVKAKVQNLEYQVNTKPSLEVEGYELSLPALQNISYSNVTCGSISAGSIGSVSPKGEIGTLKYLTDNGVTSSISDQGGYYTGQTYKESEYDKNNSSTETSDKVDPSVQASGTWHWPTTSKRITCGYLGYSGHYAIDIGVAYQPVYAANNGVVQTVQRKSTGYGYMVFINHQNGYYSRYGHLSVIDVKVGDTVKKGQKIGTSGNTGNSTGPHLHFEIRTDTKSQPSYAPNPMSFY